MRRVRTHIVLQVEVNISPRLESHWPEGHMISIQSQSNPRAEVKLEFYFWISESFLKYILNLGIWDFVMCVFFCFFFFGGGGGLIHFIFASNPLSLWKPLCATVLFSEGELYLKCSLPSMLTQPWIIVCMCLLLSPLKQDEETKGLL